MVSVHCYRRNFQSLKNQRNCKRRHRFCLSLKVLEKWEWSPATTINTGRLAVLLSWCGFGVGSGRGTEESPELPLISVNALNVPHCPAGGTYRPYFLLSWRDWTYFRLEYLKAMKPSIACLPHERQISICVKELLSANLFTTYLGTFSKTYAGEHWIHMWSFPLQHFVPNF